jgi:N-acetylglucosamine kinase-like BadF-type ATPase
MPRTLLGIDGGGSTTTARLEDGHGSRLFERVTGPTNPDSTPFEEVRARFDDLLTACRPPDAIAVCLAGMASAATGERVGGWFRERFRGAVVRTEPDYAAAVRCFDPEPAICVIAGTGSLVCSRDGRGTLVTSGGTGHRHGDEGSAYRLGRALVARYADDPRSVDGLGPAIARAVGVDAPDGAVAALRRPDTPPAVLAAAAPVLCRAADDGHAWAVALVTAEMDGLGALAAAHADRHGLTADLSLGLVGGVWSSPAARAAFDASLRDRRGGRPAAVAPAVRTPAQAAVLLAREAVG